MADFVPVTADEWDVTDELWRMLHQALNIGCFTSRKRLRFCVASCLHFGESLPEEYRPLLFELDLFSDRPDLPTVPTVNSRLVDCFPWTEKEQGKPVVVAHQAIQAACRAILDQRVAELLTPGEIFCEGHPLFEMDERVFYAIDGHVFAAARGDGKGSLMHSRKEADLLRDLLGNPFRPVDCVPEWRTDTALALARGMYASCDFSAMPILADALQDAGCENAAVLDHCRGSGPHYRGCWVVDLVLGKG
jgi:hypothetical protein